MKILKAAMGTCITPAPARLGKKLGKGLHLIILRPPFMGGRLDVTMDDGLYYDMKVMKLCNDYI